MVFLRAATPALAQLLDAATSAAAADESGNGSGAARTAAGDFLDDRLRSLVHTQTPSQLENALWIYLIAQRQLLTRAEESTVASPTPPTDGGAGLPVPLRLPPCIATVSEAVQWYCGELSVTADTTAAASTDVPTGNSTTSATAVAAAASPTASSSPSKSKPTFRLRPEPQPTPAEKPGARLDDLLRQRQQPPPPPPPEPGTDPASAAAPRAAASGPLATVALALSALAQPKRASALRQPRTLRLLVRDFVSAWSLVYLCRQLRRHTLRKERLLTGAATGAVDVKRGNSAVLVEAGDAAPMAVCFHDYDLLLPWDTVQQVLGQQASSLSAVAAQCRAVDAARAAADSAAVQSTAARAPIALVINPAVTQVDDNPDRLRKNARVDAIDEAANKYYYALLSTHAHGQTSGRGGAGAGGNSAAAAASAAAHQEALRSSLAAVDLGEYGVLDPSRMRAPSLLSGGVASASGGGGGGGGALVGSAGTSESAARSYALFLRDASIGFDIQIMAFSGAGVGYYLGYLRGLSSEWCTLYAVVGLVTMMLVDAVLLMIRVGRQDEAVLKARKRIRRQREKLEKEGEKLVQTMQATAAAAAAAAGAENTAAAVPEEAAPNSRETDALTKKKQ